MTITIQDMLDRGYIEPDNNPRRFDTAYRWTGLGQVNVNVWATPESHVDLINKGLIRHCVCCLRTMMYKPAGQKDPAHSWRVVCRGCFADGKRLEPVT